MGVKIIDRPFIAEDYTGVIDGWSYNPKGECEAIIRRATLEYLFDNVKQMENQND